MNPNLSSGELVYRLVTLGLLLIAVVVNVVCGFKLPAGLRLVYRIGAFVAGLMAVAWTVLIFTPVSYSDWISVVKWTSAIAIGVFYIGPGVTQLWAIRALARVIERRYQLPEEDVRETHP